MFRLLRPAAFTLSVLLATACGPGSDIGVDPLPEQLPPIAEAAEVLVLDHRFEPDAITVSVGAEVTWIWQGRAAHDVVGSDFDSGVLMVGEFSHVFTDVGAHRYVCTLHPGMVATVFVVDPADQ